MPNEQPTKLSCREAAAFLGVSERQLERWRVERRGPPFFRPPGSRPFYLRSDLVLYLQRSRVKTISEKPSETLRFPPFEHGILPPTATDSPEENTE